MCVLPYGRGMGLGGGGSEIVGGRAQGACGPYLEKWHWGCCNSVPSCPPLTRPAADAPFESHDVAVCTNNRVQTARAIAQTVEAVSSLNRPRTPIFLMLWPPALHL